MGGTKSVIEGVGGTESVIRGQVHKQVSIMLKTSASASSST